MKNFLALIRPHQWIKNGFVCIGFFFSPTWNAHLFIHVAAAFVAFCVAASAVYVLNDIRDAQADRLHPTKCKRPIASGAISVKHGWMLALVLAVLALGCAGWVGAMGFAFVLAYLLMNVAYSAGLKHVVILDVFIISAGFMLRILMGTKAIGIPPSQWLLLTGLMVTLFLGFAKRRAELLLLENLGQANKSAARRVLDDYSPVVLDQLIGVTAAGTILCYSLYTISPITMAVHRTHNLFFTVPLVMYGMFRYLFLLHHHSRGGDTARDLFTDRHLLLTAVTWLGASVLILQ